MFILMLQFCHFEQTCDPWQRTQDGRSAIMLGVNCRCRPLIWTLPTPLALTFRCSTPPGREHTPPSQQHFCCEAWYFTRDFSCRLPTWSKCDLNWCGFYREILVINYNDDLIVALPVEVPLFLNFDYLLLLNRNYYRMWSIFIPGHSRWLR
jgi:hypothetical protein